VFFQQVKPAIAECIYYGNWIPLNNCSMARTRRLFAKIIWHLHTMRQFYNGRMSRNYQDTCSVFKEEHGLLVFDVCK